MEANNRIFVGGIPVRVDKKTIVDFFGQFGKIKYCKIKKNSKTGRSLGYAYITFEDPNAIQTLVNRQIEFCGRICECKQVFRKTELREELAKEKRKKMLVYDLDLNITNTDLKDYFDKFATVSHAYVVKDPEGQNNKGFGYVVFNNEEDLNSFCEKKHNLILNNKPFKYSNEFHVPPKKKKETNLKTSSNQGEPHRKAGGQHRKGSQKARGEEASDSDLGKSISMEDSDEDSPSNPASTMYEGKPEAKTNRNQQNGELVDQKDSKKSVSKEKSGCSKKALVQQTSNRGTESAMRPDSSLGTIGKSKLLFDQDTGGTKTTKQSNTNAGAEVISSATMQLSKIDKKMLWRDILQVSLLLDELPMNYKFNRRRYQLQLLGGASIQQYQQDARFVSNYPVSHPQGYEDQTQPHFSSW